MILRSARASRVLLASCLALQAWPCRAQAVSIAPAALPAPAPMLLLEGPRVRFAGAASDPELRWFYAATGRRELAGGAHPALEPFLKRLVPFVERLLTDADGRGAVRLTLVDDMRPGISLVELPSGGRVLALNLGTLKEVRNDDELAYLVGQELERGNCDINDDIAGLRERGGSLDALRADLLRNALDSEADIRSLLGRVIEKGYNPHSAYDLLTRLIEEAEGLRGRADYSSRRDALALALTYWTRRLGRDPNDRFGDRPRQEAVLGDLRPRLFEDPSFLRERRRSAVEAMKAPSHRAAQAYAGVQDEERIKDFANAYEEDFHANWDEFQREAYGLFKPKAQVDLQLMLHERLDRAYEAGRRRSLREPFKALSLEHLDDFLRLEHRPLVLSAKEPGEVMLDIRRTQGEIDEARKTLAESEDEDEKAFALEELQTLPGKLEGLRKDYALARRVFSGKEADALLRSLVGEPEETRNLWSHTHTPERLLEQGFRLRLVEGYASRVLGRRKEAIEASMPVLLGSDSFGEAMGLFLEARPGAGDLATLLRAYARYAGRVLGMGWSERTAGWIGATWWRGRDDGLTIWRFFRDYFAFDPGAAREIWLDLMKVFVENTQGLSAVSSLITAVWGLEEDNAGPLLQEEAGKGLLLSRLDSSFQEALSEAGSRSEVLNALTYYQAALWMLSGRAKNPLSEQASDAMLESAVAGMDGRRETSRALLLARYPWLFHVSGEKGDARRLEVARGLGGISGMEGLGPVLDYGYLVRLLFDESDPEAFYRLVSGLKEFVQFGDEPEADGPCRTVAAGFLAWLSRERPGDIPLARSVGRYEGSEGKGLSSFLADRIRSLIESRAASGPFGAVRDGVYEFWRKWHDLRYPPFNCDALGEAVRSGIPERPLDALDFLTASAQGVSRLVAEITAEKSVWYFGTQTEWENRVDVWRLEELLGDEAVLKAASPAQLARGFASLAASRSGPQPQLGRIFERIFPIVSRNGEAAAFLDDPGLVRKLYFLSSTKKLALWQLERKFGLSRMGGSAGDLGKDEARPEIDGIYDLIEAQLPKESLLRDEIIDEAEKRMLSSQAESNLFETLRTGEENWTRQQGLEVMSAPQLAARIVKSHSDRIVLIRYLVGPDPDPPHFKSAGFVQEAYKKDIQAARTLFQEAETPLRVFLLQPLLDENSGILSDPEAAEDLYRFVLGEGRGWSGVFRSKFMRAYLKALSPGERKAVLGAILSGFVGRPPGSPSLKSILEAMGPFGVKVGQFLRTSGLLSRPERAELDGFLDRALEPSRRELYKTLERIFGEDLDGIEWVGPLLGSGSLNEVVLLRVRDPLDGSIRLVAARMQREGAEGLVANENPVWERAIAELKADADPMTRRLASLIDEARRFAYDNLKPGGVELDLSLERAAYPDAAGAYSDGPDATGLRVEVISPLSGLQERLVPAEHSKKVSLYDFVPGAKLRDLGALDRFRAAWRIVSAELRAMFRRSFFDPDSHSGNWVNDLAHGREVRIDYAQLRPAGGAGIEAFRRAMAALVRPVPDEGMRSELAEALGSVFSFSGGEPSREEVLQALASALAEGDLPEPCFPHDRLMCLQDRMEKTLRKAHPELEISLAPEARGALASLAKIAVYEESLGKSAFSLLLLRGLGVSAAEYAWLAGKAWAAKFK